MSEARLAPTVLEVRELVKHFPLPSSQRGRGHDVVHAVCGVSFRVGQGETFGIVGESGSGKTTVLRTLLGLEKPTSGVTVFDGQTVVSPSQRTQSGMRRQVAAVFQNPFTSLDPRMTVEDIVSEPARVQKVRLPPGSVGKALDSVHLPRSSAARLPHEFSGGQRQRIAIARALIVGPKAVALDEPLSALDVSTQGQILQLLMELQEQLGISYILVSHDLAVVANISTRLGVMYGGQMVEQGSARDVIETPQHGYTKVLLAAVPVPEPETARKKVKAFTRSWPSAEDTLPACPFGERA